MEQLLLLLPKENSKNPRRAQGLPTAPAGGDARTPRAHLTIARVLNPFRARERCTPFKRSKPKQEKATEGESEHGRDNRPWVREVVLWFDAVPIPSFVEIVIPFLVPLSATQFGCAADAHVASFAGSGYCQVWGACLNRPLWPLDGGSRC